MPTFGFFGREAAGIEHLNQPAVWGHAALAAATKPRNIRCRRRIDPTGARPRGGQQNVLSAVRF
jgi:hypothetical protein